MKRVNKFVVLACFVFLSLNVSAATKRIGIIVFDGVLTSDITAPIEVFGEASHQSWFSNYEVITIAASDSILIKTEQGIRIKANVLLKDNPRIDVLLVPSAYDMAPLLNNPELITYIQNHAKKVEWLASNCSGAFLLGKAGVLNGVKATTWAGGEDDLKRAFPKIDVQWDQNVVVDGNVITSNGSIVSYEAALVLLGKIASPKKAKEVAEALQFTRVSKKRLFD